MLISNYTISSVATFCTTFKPKDDIAGSRPAATDRTHSQTLLESKLISILQHTSTLSLCIRFTSLKF